MGGQRAHSAASADASTTLYSDAQVQAGGDPLAGSTSSSAAVRAQHSGSAANAAAETQPPQAHAPVAAGLQDGEPVLVAQGTAPAATVAQDAVRPPRPSGPSMQSQHPRDQQDGQQEDVPSVVPVWQSRQQQGQQEQQGKLAVVGTPASQQLPSHLKPHVHTQQQQQQSRPMGMPPGAATAGGAAAAAAATTSTAAGAGPSSAQPSAQQHRGQAERSSSGHVRSGSQQLPVIPIPIPIPFQQPRQQQRHHQQQHQQQVAQQQQQQQLQQQHQLQLQQQQHLQQQQQLQQQQLQQQQQQAMYQAAHVYAVPPGVWPGMAPVAYGGVRMVMSPYGPMPLMPHMAPMAMQPHMGHMGMMWQAPQQLLAPPAFTPELVTGVQGSARQAQPGRQGARRAGDQGPQGAQVPQAHPVQAAAAQAAAAQAAVAQQLAQQGYFYPVAPGPWGVPRSPTNTPLASFYAMPQPVVPAALPAQPPHGRGAHGSSSSTSSRHGSGSTSSGSRHGVLVGGRQGSSPAPPASPGVGVGALVPPLSPTTLPQGRENSGWAWLVDGILQQVSAHLAGHSAMRSFRLACRHWRAVADSNVESLSPSSLRPKELVVLFPRLTVLRLIHCPNVRNRDLYVLAQSCIALRSLTIGDDSNKPWVTNRGLCSIGRMRSLTDLSLHDCNSITNNGLTSLAGLGALTALSLRGCKKITNNGLEVLQANTTLTSLNLHGCKRISDKGLAALTALPLTSLWLGMTRVKDEGMVYLAQLTALTELQCTNEEITDEGVAHLSCLTALRTLALRDCCEVSGDALQALLPSLPHLTHLNLHKSWEFADSQLLKCIVHMLGLHTLDLRGTWVTDKGLSELTQLSNLRRLALAPQVELYSDALGVISTLTQLTGLVFSGLARFYTPAVTEALCSLTGLKDLDLSTEAFEEEPAHREPLPDHLLTSLAQLPLLTTLDLSRRTLAPPQLHALLDSLPKLCELRLDGCPLEKEQLRALECAFPLVDVRMRVPPAPDVDSGSGGEEEDEQEVVLVGLGALAV